MSDNPMKSSARRRKFAFQPLLTNQRMEPRVLLSGLNGLPVTSYVQNHFLLTHPASRNAAKANNPPVTTPHAPAFRRTPTYNKGVADTQTAAGGASVVVATPDGNRFRISIGLADDAYGTGLTSQTGGTGNNVVPSAKVQAVGTVRAYAMPGGKVGLIIDGTNAQSAVTIDPLPQTQRKGYAHSFAYGQAGRTHILNVGSINVTSGSIGQILGFHSVDLSGPLVVGGSTTVDRIAFNSLQPGAALAVGGTLNTLDIAQGVNLSNGQGIQVGRDLNLFNVGQDLSLTNGASLTVGRYMGLVPQPPKGTGLGSNFLSLNQAQVGSGNSFGVPSLSANIGGNLNLGAGSAITIKAGIANSSITSASPTATPTVFLVNGTVTGSGTLNIPNLVISQTFSSGANFVFRTN